MGERRTRDSYEVILDVDKFRRFLPGYDLQVVEAGQIPQKAMEWFELWSAKHIDVKRYKPGNFKRFFVIRQDGSTNTTYVGQQLKEYDGGEIEDTVHLIEVNAEEVKMGHGELRHNITSDQAFFVYKPFQGFIATDDNFLRKGLAMRRTLVMNALSRTLYGLTMHSDILMTSIVRNLFEKLHSEGKVRKYSQNGQDRYVFKI